MQKRYPLRRLLIEAWNLTIKDHYSKQLINSERSLQCYFGAAILQKFKNGHASKRLFIEPRFKADTPKERRYPDIVICNAEQIVAVVEIKYQPRVVSPACTNDLKKLQWIAEHQEGFEISNERFLGRKTEKKRYKLAADAVLCWAGVYRGPHEKLNAKFPPKLQRQFLELHAVTCRNEDPEIIPKFKSSSGQ